MVDQTALKNIEELHRLKTEGLITEDDYEKAKERLLFGGRPAAPRGAASVLPAAVRPLPGSGPVPLPGEEDHFAWVLLPLKRCTDFQGRSRRKEFWMFQLVFVALTMLASAAGVDLLAGGGGAGGLVLVVVWLALVALALPLVAVQVRRLHDQDRTGWLALLNLVPYLGTLALYMVMLFEGTDGDNRFGPDPRAGTPGSPA